MGKKSGSSDNTGAILASQAAQSNAAVGRESLAFAREQWNESKGRQASLDTLTSEVMQDSLDVSKENRAHANTEWEKYTKLYQPLEEKMVAQVGEYGTEASLGRATQRAAADVGAQFEAGRVGATRDAAAVGMGNSARMGDIIGKSRFSEAATTAGAMNAAREGEREKALSLTAATVDAGRGLPNSAAQAYGLTLQGGNSAVGAAQSANQYGLARQSAMQQGFGTAINAFSSATQGYLGVQGANDRAAERRSAAQAGAGQLIGTIGMAAATAF